MKVPLPILLLFCATQSLAATFDLPQEEFDLFGYDYDELNRDIGIQEARAHTFITEVYNTATGRKVWAIEALSVRKRSAEELLAEQVVTVVTQLREDGLLGR